MRSHITSREKCREENWMSGECYSLHHKNVQVFPSKGDNKFPSAPSGASRPFCWFSLTVHCLIKAKGIHDLYLRDRSSLYGFKLVPLSKRDLPLSLTLSCSLHGAVFRVTPRQPFSENSHAWTLEVGAKDFTSSFPTNNLMCPRDLA